MSNLDNIILNGKVLKACVARIIEKDAEGLPRKLEMVYDDETVQLSEDDPTKNEFLIAFINEDMVTKAVRN